MHRFCGHGLGRSARRLLVLAAMLCGSVGAVAHTPSPTAGQIDTFKNMSPEQQQAVLEAMGAGGGANTRSGVTQSDPSLASPLTVTPKFTVGGTERELAAIVASRGSVLFVAHDEDGEIVGSLTLVLFRIPTGFVCYAPP